MAERPAHAPRSLAPGPGASYLRRVLACVAARVLVTLFFGGLGGVSALLTSLCGAGFVPGTVDSLAPFYLLLSAAPDILLCYLLADLIPSGIQLDGSYVLPRLSEKRKWALRRSLFLGALVLGYVVASFVLSVLVIWVTYGVLLDLGPLSARLLPCLAVSLIGLCALVFGINLLSLFHDAVASFALVIGVHLSVLLALRYAPSGLSETLAPWAPSARALPAWHAGVLASLGFDGCGAQMSALVSFALLAALLLAEILLLCRSIRRTDIL